ARAAGVHHAFWYALVVEMGDLLPGMEILQQGGSAFADTQRIVGVVDPNTLLCRQVAGVPLDAVLVELLLLWICVLVSHCVPSQIGIPGLSTQVGLRQTAHACRPRAGLLTGPALLTEASLEQMGLAL